ncbi:MAG TPA: hypothetical protein VFM45_05795 [Anaeromyxobacteraceae bacterium]|nr:hypothetical protein [Anaeromyxobacteraceae bacterium]
MDTWKRLWRSPWRAALVAGAGALVGVAYYELVGCRTGTCAITSSAWRSAAYFALVGAVVGWPGRPARTPAPSDPASKG